VHRSVALGEVVGAARPAENSFAGALVAEVVTGVVTGEQRNEMSAMSAVVGECLMLAMKKPKHR
jgi:hypothetical protein